MRQYFPRLNSFKGLTWFATFVAVLAVKLPSIEAVKEGTARKQSLKGKTKGALEVNSPVLSQRPQVWSPTPLPAPINPPLHEPLHPPARLRSGNSQQDERRQGPDYRLRRLYGESYGPHLHFELFKDQQDVDPLSVDLPAEDSIEPALQNIFENQTRIYLVEMSLLPETSPQS